MQAGDLEQLFPKAGEIPKEYDLTHPIEQKEYLVNAIAETLARQDELLDKLGR